MDFYNSDRYFMGAHELEPYHERLNLHNPHVANIKVSLNWKLKIISNSWRAGRIYHKLLEIMKYFLASSWD